MLGSYLFAQEEQGQVKAYKFDVEQFDSYPKEKSKTSSVENNFDQFEKKYSDNSFIYDENKLLDEKNNLLTRIGLWLNKFFKKFDIFDEVSLEKWIERILILLGAVLIIYVLYRIIVSGNAPFIHQRKEEKNEDPLRYIEKNLLDLELDDLILDAKNSNNFPLAIRLLHLSNVKKLAKKNLIDWSYQKTNTELSNEISDENIKTKFLENTAIFNEIWFGLKPISKEDFLQYETLFNQFNSRLG